MEQNALTKCLIVHIHTGLPPVSSYLMVGAAISLKFKSGFIIKSRGDLADQPGRLLL